MPSERVSGLSETLWPFHLKPHPGELLSSWLIRLAHAHGYKVERLCRKLLGVGAAMWNRDIDRSADARLAAAVMSVTAASKQQFWGSTLQALGGKLSEQIEVRGYSRWIIPLSIYHRTRRKPGLMYCSVCLANDVDPYFRMIWRLAFVTVCTRHGINLNDSCPQCRAPLMPHRTDVGYKSYAPRDKLLIRCHCCGFDLRLSDVKQAESALVDFTRQLEETISSGFTSFGGNPNLHSLAYFAGLRILIRAARRVVNENPAVLANEAETKSPPIVRADIELLPLVQRRRLMAELIQILGEGPEKIGPYLKERSFLYSKIEISDSEMPYWLAQALLPLKRSQHPDRLPAEVSAIAEAVQRKTGYFTPSAARTLFGAHFDPRTLPVTYRSDVSDDAYEHLMAWLDHEIGRTVEPRLRFALLQDKVIFGLFRLTDLTTSEIANLKTTEVPKPSEEVSFDTEPRTEQQAFSRLSWHVKRIRDMHEAADKFQNVFLSPHTGRPIGATAIQERFKLTVKRAFLTSSIAGMRHFKRTSDRAAE